jgi:hypothetical protein
MIERVEDRIADLLNHPWFERLLIASVIYAAIWLFFLPRSIVSDLALYYAVALWLGVLSVVVFEFLLALARGFRQNFLPWDGHTERRMRERSQPTDFAHPAASGQ